MISHIENHESTALITEDERLNIDENRSILLTQIEGFKRIAEKYEYLAPFLLTRFGNCSVQLKDIWQPDNADDEVVVTGGGDADKWKFFKATPVKNPPEKIQCGDCPKTFQNPKSLQRHAKNKHEKHVDIGPLIPKVMPPMLWAPDRCPGRRARVHWHPPCDEWWLRLLLPSG